MSPLAARMRRRLAAMLSRACAVRSGTPLDYSRPESDITDDRMCFVVPAELRIDGLHGAVSRDSAGFHISVDRVGWVQQLPHVEAVGGGGGDQYGEARVAVASSLQPPKGSDSNPDPFGRGFLRQPTSASKQNQSTTQLSRNAPEPLRFAVVSGSGWAFRHDLGRSGEPRTFTRSYLIRSARIGG